MFELSFGMSGKHTYCLAATGLRMRTQNFNSRESAKEKMYAVMSKNGLQLLEVYDDKHFKTYVCTDGVRFYINRLY